jgi:protocadherin-16/23
MEINLQNIVDDNAPQFTQKHYISTIKEGELTGSFVAQISALDIDNIKETKDNNRPALTYHILEGNHDNAFVIDPPGSGTIRTNIVLDREIRDHYLLKIVANDAQHSDGLRTSEPSSNFQLSSHCTLEIIVIDGIINNTF